MAEWSWPLQQALFARLETALPSVLVRDTPDPDCDLPLVVIGDEVVADASTKDRAGAVHRLTVQVFARGAGMQAVKELMAAVSAALRGASLVVPGVQVVTQRVVSSRVLREADGIGRRGLVEVEVRVLNTS